MNKAVAALVLLALASPALAENDVIIVPSLTAIPFVLSSSGDRPSGHIKNWGSLSKENGNFTAVTDRAVNMLQETCGINFGVVKNSTGRIDPEEGTAAIACMRRDGETLIETVVPGTLVDSTGTTGLKNVDVGTHAFFVVQSAIRIPLVDEQQ
ncbi:hypothetical protein [Pseudomonas sp. NPDC089569]|uniref:hypothetical protein n=1 Tax=Pseudomonas sp. NPDC089569 TaxID=3390722 RepID=UPI003CFC4639